MRTRLVAALAGDAIIATARANFAIPGWTWTYEIESETLHGCDSGLAVASLDPAGQPGPQPGDRLVHLVGRRLAVPERVGQLTQADQAATGEQQRRQRLVGLRSARPDRAAGVVGDLQRTEHPELHARDGRAPARTIRSVDLEPARNDGQS